jgi:hypothetical protein
MPQSRIPFKTLQPRLVKHIGNVAHPLFKVKLLPIGTHNTSGFLSPVLECINAKICDSSSFRVRYNPENSAFLFQFISR